MRVSISGPLTHLCPYVDEVDVGTFEISYNFGDGLIELHALRDLISSFHTVKTTHEELTKQLSDAYPYARVRTTFQTAGLQVITEAP